MHDIRVISIILTNRSSFVSPIKMSAIMSRMLKRMHIILGRILLSHHVVVHLIYVDISMIINIFVLGKNTLKKCLACK